MAGKFSQLSREPPIQAPVTLMNQWKQTSTEEVLKEISLPDCSTGVDQILLKYVKQVSDLLTVPLARIINVCISNSQFPRLWKTARISPVP